MGNDISRREFLKISGAGAIGVAAAACASGRGGQQEPVSGQPQQQGTMEMRTNPGNGDKVSLLGYGCMRWPMVKDDSGRDVIDQQKVNELIDYAMKHGVNYYDTSPAYST